MIWECQPTSSTTESAVYRGKYFWKLIQTLPNAHTRSIYTIDWSVDNVIATGCADNAVRIFARVRTDHSPFSYKQDPTTKEFTLQLTKHNAHSTDVNCVAWSPTVPSLLVTCGDDEVIKFWHYS